MYIQRKCEADSVILQEVVANPKLINLTASHSYRYEVSAPDAECILMGDHMILYKNECRSSSCFVEIATFPVTDLENTF